MAADLIPAGSTAADPGAAPAPDAPDPTATAPAGPAGQAVDGADAGGPRAVGTVEQAQADQNDPTQPSLPTADEQAQYDQFVSRFTLILSDTGKGRPAHATGPSVHDAILQSLNNPKVPLPVAIGTTTAQIAMMIVTQAQASKVTYSPDVLFNACIECCALVYVTGLASHIFKGCPPYKGLDSDGQYDFNDFEIHLLCAAQMQAVRVFGTMELKAGMISPEMRQQNLEFWKQQVHREMASGMVNQDVLEKLHQSGVLNPKPQGSDPMGDGPQPIQPPAAPPAAAPAPTTPPAGAAGIAGGQ